VSNVDRFSTPEQKDDAQEALAAKLGMEVAGVRAFSLGATMHTPVGGPEKKALAKSFVTGTKKSDAMIALYVGGYTTPGMGKAIRLANGSAARSFLPDNHAPDPK